MKNLIVVIITLFGMIGGSAARILAVLTRNLSDEMYQMNIEYDQPLIRRKRQFNFGPFGQSFAQANANAFGNFFGPQGFGSSSSNANANSFNSQSPFGSFGGSSANSATNNVNCGFFGCSGNQGSSQSQSYTLPNGEVISLAFSNGVNFSPGGQPNFSNSGAISYGGKKYEFGR